MKSLYKKASTKSSIVGDPTKPYHPVTNPDGYFPMQNTRADSLALYKNALLKDSFYENNPDYVKETNPLTDFRDNSFRDRIIREVMSPALPASINPVVSQPLIDDVKRRSSSFTKKLSSSEEKAMQNKLGETRFGPVPGTNLYQFGDILINDMNAYYNPLAPPIYLHPHIKPQGSNRYYSERFSDRTEVPYYDPIAIAPVDILNDEQLKKRIKKYGKDSVPQSVYTRLNRNQDIKPMPTLDASKYLTSERPAPIAQSVKYEHDPTWGKNLYIQFKDPKQSTRTSQEIFHFGDWGTFMEFNDALRNAGRMFNTFSSNAKKNQGSASYGGTTKEEAMEIYKQYTTPKTGYRTGGVFKDPPPSPIPSGVNVFATSNSIYKTPNNTTVNKPAEYNPVYKNLAEKNFTQQELAAINNKKPDVLKQDRSIPKSVQLTLFEQKVLEKEMEAQTFGQQRVTYNQFGEPVLKWDPSMPKATGRIEPDYMDPITMAATFGAGAYGKGLSLADAALVGLDAGTYGASSLGKSIGANASKYLQKGYNQVATGNSFLTEMGVPAWKIEKPNQKIFGIGKDLRTYIAKNATDREAELYTKFGQGMHNLTPEDWADFEALTKSGATDFTKVNTPISRIPLYYNSSGQAWDEARKLLNLKRGQIYKTPSNKSIRTWSAGIPEGYSAERIARSKPEQKIRLVIPSRYTKNLGNEFAAMPYHDPRVKFLYNENGTFNLNAASENELMGNIPGGFMKIGSSREDGYYNIIIKPIKVPKPTSISSSLESVKPNFKSEIDWGKWNPETPNYPELINEYNAIEESTKKAGTWMKNPDGSPFQGTPEQFIQQQSSWFKKAFPNVIKNEVGVPQLNYHGSPSKFSEILPDKEINGRIYGEGLYTTPNIELAQRYAKGENPQMYQFYINANNPRNASNYIQEGVAKADEKLNKILKEFGENSKEYKKGIDEYNEALEYLRKNRTKIDLRKHSIGEAEDYMRIKDVQVTPFDNRVKSAVGNVGFFDMTNPNIYKAIVPATIGATTLGAIEQKKKGDIKTYYKGGLIKRADGSYSQRGLWDNIRANRGSGKEPTKQMLEQEKKIKAKYSEGGITSLKDLDPKTMKKYIADLKNQENDAKKGYTNSRWYPHASVEGGSDTIAYGHKILPNEDFSKGLSDYEAEQLLQRDVLVHQANAKKQIDNKYGEGTFNSLPQDRQMLLVDYDYNLGSLSKFPNFVDAAVKGNNEKMLKEYVRYSGGKPLKKRNDWSLNVINNMSQPVYSRIPPPDNLFKHLSLPVDNLIIKKTIP